MILGGNCPGSNNPGVNYLGAIFLAGNCPETFGNYLGTIFFGGNCPRGDNPGGQSSREQSSEGQFYSGAIVWTRLLTIYKTVIMPHFGYGDIVYDKHLNNGFLKNWDCSQCSFRNYGKNKKVHLAKIAWRIRVRTPQTMKMDETPWAIF